MNSFFNSEHGNLGARGVNSLLNSKLGNLGARGSGLSLELRTQKTWVKQIKLGAAQSRAVLKNHFNPKLNALNSSRINI